MSIKMRLLLSYIAMTVLPIALFALIVVSAASLLLRGDGGDGDGSGPARMPAFWEQASERDELAAGLRVMARADSARFGDEAFWREADGWLNEAGAGLVITKDGVPVFVSPAADHPGLSDRLREQRGDDASHHSSERLPSPHTWRGADSASRYSVQKAGEFVFADGSTGAAYVVSDDQPFIEIALTIVPIVLLSLLLAVGLTNGALTFFVSRSLVKPLYTLKQAALQIKEGNLTEPVRLARNDEIGQLGAAFEEMRVRLNESIRLQLQYEDNRKELVASMSHDLKTPITAMRACVEGIRDGVADTGEKRDKYMRMIASKLEEMDRLIDELTLFSKLDLKQLPFELRPLDLVAYLRDCVEELRADPRAEGIDIELAVRGEADVVVLADREKLRRVIMNIVNNSMKYMDKEPKSIRFELVRSGREAAVRIADSGPGIDAAALPFVFDRFYRVEPSRNAATGGSGLGLAIVRQIVEGQGGAVRAYNGAGEGTVVEFTLPIQGEGGERR